MLSLNSERAVLQSVSMMYLSVPAVAGRQLAGWLGDKQHIAALAMGLVGILFCGFAVKLWTAAL